MPYLYQQAALVSPANSRQVWAQVTFSAIYLFIRLFVCLFGYLFVYLFIRKRNALTAYNTSQVSFSLDILLNNVIWLLLGLLKSQITPC